LALAAVASRVDRVIRMEVQLPSDVHVPLFARVVLGTREQLVLLVLGIVVAEILYNVASRRVLAASAGLLPEDGLASRRPLGVVLHGAVRAVRQPWRVLGTAALAWMTSVVVLVPLAWALFTAWSGVRGVYLSPVSGGGLEAVLGALTITLLLVGIWIVSIVLAGFASALRAAMWSVDTLA
jgi:hypothetical protein